MFQSCKRYARNHDSRLKLDSFCCSGRQFTYVRHLLWLTNGGWGWGGGGVGGSVACIAALLCADLFELIL